MGSHKDSEFPPLQGLCVSKEAQWGGIYWMDRNITPKIPPPLLLTE